MTQNAASAIPRFGATLAALLMASLVPRLLAAPQAPVPTLVASHEDTPDRLPRAEIHHAVEPEDPPRRHSFEPRVVSFRERAVTNEVDVAFDLLLLGIGALA